MVRRGLDDLKLGDLESSASFTINFGNKDMAAEVLMLKARVLKLFHSHR